MSKKKNLVNKFLICIFVFFTFLVFSNTNGVAVYGGSVFGPALVKPDTFPIAPWDTIEIIFNTTDLDYPIQNASFFYTFKDSEAEEPTEWEDFERVNMNLELGDNYTGTWSYELLPRHKNGTTLYYFANLIDENGYDHSGKNSPDGAYAIRILQKSPFFEIRDFRINKINEKNLTCDVHLTIDMHGIYNASNSIDVTLTNSGDSRILKVETTNVKGEYFSNIDVESLQLVGEPSYFPFDDYILQLNFWFRFGKTGPIFHSEKERIDVYDYNDRTKWNVKLVENRTGNYDLDLSIDLSRKTGSIYFFVIPTIACYFLLGGSHLLSAEEDKIRNRLTIYLTVFVFIIGSFSTNQIIRDLIPAAAIGATTAETTVTSLALYSAIYCISSILASFWFSTEKRRKYSLLFDLLSILIVLLIFFAFPIVDITSLIDRTSEVRTLYQHINCQWFVLFILIGLSYGFIVHFIKVAYLKLKAIQKNSSLK